MTKQSGALDIKLWICRWFTAVSAVHSRFKSDPSTDTKEHAPLLGGHTAFESRKALKSEVPVLQGFLTGSSHSLSSLCHCFKHAFQTVRWSTITNLQNRPQPLPNSGAAPPQPHTAPECLSRWAVDLAASAKTLIVFSTVHFVCSQRPVKKRSTLQRLQRRSTSTRSETCVCLMPSVLGAERLLKRPTDKTRRGCQLCSSIYDEQPFAVRGSTGAAASLVAKTGDACIKGSWMNRYQDLLH